MARKHRSKRDAGIGLSPVRRNYFPSAEVNGATVKLARGSMVPVFVVSFPELASAERSKLLRLVSRHFPDTNEIIDEKLVTDSTGQAVAVPVVLKIWGLPQTLAILARYVDTTNGIVAEAYTGNRTDRPCGGSGAPRIVKRAERLNKLQKLAHAVNPNYQRQADAEHRQAEAERDLASGKLARRAEFLKETIARNWDNPEFAAQILGIPRDTARELCQAVAPIIQGFHDSPELADKLGICRSAADEIAKRFR